ncbi:hypothetical protein RchiOBHm_Chr1g0349491 [Rosa chinensis]|uniref:Uncharacterized protein n=1 Tax=Rosa chinensis TaxID=74649 RepID=A0A2P6SFW9_ROSCH|nr:hypothetical protein RchiOBHm_Chr1g0349491 [Rosa chinensis]
MMSSLFCSFSSVGSLEELVGNRNFVSGYFDLRSWYFDLTHCTLISSVYLFL